MDTATSPMSQTAPPLISSPSRASASGSQVLSSAPSTDTPSPDSQLLSCPAPCLLANVAARLDGRPLGEVFNLDCSTEPPHSTEPGPMKWPPGHEGAVCLTAAERQQVANLSDEAQKRVLTKARKDGQSVFSSVLTRLRNDPFDPTADCWSTDLQSLPDDARVYLVAAPDYALVSFAWIHLDFNLAAEGTAALPKQRLSKIDPHQGYGLYQHKTGDILKSGSKKSVSFGRPTHAALLKTQFPDNCCLKYLEAGTLTLDGVDGAVNLYGKVWLVHSTTREYKRQHPVTKRPYVDADRLQELSQMFSIARELFFQLYPEEYDGTFHMEESMREFARAQTKVSSMTELLLRPGTNFIKCLQSAAIQCARHYSEMGVILEFVNLKANPQVRV